MLESESLMRKRIEEVKNRKACRLYVTEPFGIHGTAFGDCCLEQYV